MAQLTGRRRPGRGTMIQMQEGGMNSGQVEFDVSEDILLELSCRETQAASRGGIHLSKRDGGISQ